MLGVMAQNITPELADAMHLKHNRGAIVTKVVPDSPAAKAGIKVQDIIESVNNTTVHSSAQLHNMLGIVRPGTRLHLEILRDHKPIELHALVGDPKKVLMQRVIPFLSGMRLQQYNDLEPDSSLLEGVMVIDVSDKSDGALAGLLPGDVIISANGKPTPTVQKLMEIAGSKPKQLLLKVARGQGQVFLVIQQSH